MKITGSQSLRGTVTASGSKAYTHRALLASLLSPEETIIRGALDCDDTNRTLEGIRSLGAKVQVERGQLVSCGAGKLASSRNPIDCGESGATLRFLAAIAGTSPEPTTLRASGRLAERPLDPLLKAMEMLGALTKVSENNEGSEVRIQGPLKGGETWIEGDISSQFISGLLFAAPLATTDVTVHVKGLLESRPYVEMSIDVLKKHGITIDEYDNAFHIPAPQNYNGALHDVPGDFSSAAFLIAGVGIAGEEITVSGLNPVSPEPDSIFLKVIDQIGLEVRNAGQNLEVRGSKLEPFEFDAVNNPDLVPPLEVLGCFAKGVSEIRGVRRLRYKETNRLETIPAELGKMGAKIKVNGDNIRIQGGTGLVGCELDSKHDHRVAMPCAIASIGASGDSSIHNAEAVSKSYPEFFHDLTRLGVKLHVE
ncbi:MAG TPA: 3-phosphoshikimate 1-carboxyvinyltransferase [Candidatus Bathyarchaeia archaeon]|nr:3-phosphoshikimate 1-carboxyvinyltransferase [Candidatus Bathyarchaeia archaeon]